MARIKIGSLTITGTDDDIISAFVHFRRLMKDDGGFTYQATDPEDTSRDGAVFFPPTPMHLRTERPLTDKDRELLGLDGGFLGVGE